MAGRSVSDRLAGLKFMQRARAKEELRKTVVEEKGNADASHWVAPGRESADTQCRVVLEGDPTPGAMIGRMSFGGFNASMEKLMEERQGVARVKQADATSVSDTEMADRFSQMRRDTCEPSASTSQQKRKVLLAKESSKEMEAEWKRPRSLENGQMEDVAVELPSRDNALGSAAFQYPSGMQSSDAKEAYQSSKQGGWRDRVGMKSKMQKR